MGPPDSPASLQSFDRAELLECIRRLVEVDKDWVPDRSGASLYVRPVFLGNEVGAALRVGRGGDLGGRARDLDSWVPDAPSWPSQPSLGVGHPSRALLYVILCPVGAYFPGGTLRPVSLLADPAFTRAWVGGVGDCKLGG